MSAELVTYADSSALVKLVVDEPESTKLRRWLRRRERVASSALARVEVARAVSALGDVGNRQLEAVLDRVELVRITDEILDIASGLEPSDLRSLDAIHLATASLFGNHLASVVTYDRRMTVAARARGWNIDAPG